MKPLLQDHSFIEFDQFKKENRNLFVWILSPFFAAHIIFWSLQMKSYYLDISYSEVPWALSLPPWPVPLRQNIYVPVGIIISTIYISQNIYISEHIYLRIYISQNIYVPLGIIISTTFVIIL